MSDALAGASPTGESIESNLGTSESRRWPTLSGNRHPQHRSLNPLDDHVLPCFTAPMRQFLPQLQPAMEESPAPTPPSHARGPGCWRAPGAGGGSLENGAAQRVSARGSWSACEGSRSSAKKPVSRRCSRENAPIVQLNPGDGSAEAIARPGLFSSTSSWQHP